jgi:hypothetical protein
LDKFYLFFYGQNIVRKNGACVRISPAERINKGGRRFPIIKEEVENTQKYDP